MTRVDTPYGAIEAELCEQCGAVIYGHRYHPALRMCARHARERLANLPPIGCSPADLEETGDRWVGLLVVLADAGWTLHERCVDDQVVLFGDSDGSAAGVHGDTAAHRALALFKLLYSDDPLAIALAAEFWPQPTAPTSLLKPVNITEVRRQADNN